MPDILQISSGSGSGVVQGAIFGLALSRSAATTVGVAAGFAVDSTGSLAITLPAFTKTFAAFAQATGNGGLDTGAIAGTTWYHVFAIAKAGGASPDVLISLSATAPTLPSGFSLFRRIGSVLTDATPAIVPFTQLGDEVLWDVPRLDVTNTTPGLLANTPALSAPLGVKTWAILTVNMLHSAGASCLITSPDSPDTAPDQVNQFSVLVNGVSQIANTEMRVRTNTSSQIRYRHSTSPITQFVLRNRGYVDTRGRFA